MGKKDKVEKGRNVKKGKEKKPLIYISDNAAVRFTVYVSPQTFLKSCCAQ